MNRAILSGSAEHGFPRFGHALLFGSLSVAAGVLIAVADVRDHLIVIAGAGIVGLLPFAVGVVRRNLDVFEPPYLFAVAFGILFVIRPMLEWSSVRGVPTMGGLDPNPTYLLAIVVASIGGLAFYAGYYPRFGQRLAARLPAPPTTLESGRMGVGVLVISTTGVLLYLVFLMTTGGLQTFAAVIAGRNPEFLAAVSQPAGYFYSGLLLLFPAGVLLLVTSSRWRSAAGALGLLLVTTSIVTAAFTGSRSAVLPAFLTVGLVWYLRRGSRPRMITVIAVSIVAFVLAISVPRDYRDTDERTGGLIDAVAASVSNLEATGKEFFLGLDTAMLPTFAIEMSYVPDVIPYRLGSTYVEAALRPIPRALWSGKPEAADTQLMNVLWPDLAEQRIGLAFSLFGEPYLNLGIVGVLAVSFLLGIAWRALWEYWRREPFNAVAIGIYAISWPFLFVYMRGGIGVDYQRQLIALAPFVALAWWAGRRESIPTRRPDRGVTMSVPSS